MEKQRTHLTKMSYRMVSFFPLASSLINPTKKYNDHLGSICLLAQQRNGCPLPPAPANCNTSLKAYVPVVLSLSSVLNENLHRNRACPMDLRGGLLWPRSPNSNLTCNLRPLPMLIKELRSCGYCHEARPIKATLVQYDMPSS